jgi:hypothetical protein
MNEVSVARSECRRRTALVGVRFLPAEKYALQQEADRLGVSLGYLIRARISGTSPLDDTEIVGRVGN